MSDGISPLNEQSTSTMQALLQQQRIPKVTINPANSRPRRCPHTGKRRRFRFRESHDVAMLDTVLKTGAHVAPHGLAQRLFCEATKQLFSSGTFSDVVDGPLPTGKTIWDRFRHLLHVHRTGNFRLPCGKGDVIQERERLLEAISRDIECKKDDVERNAERRKLIGGKRILEPKDDRSVRRRLDFRSGEDNGDLEGDVHKQTDFVTDPAQHVEAVTPEISAALNTPVHGTEERWKRELEAMRLDLEKKVFEAEEAERKRRFEIDARHAKIEEERAVIEMRRLEMEDQERKSARQERQALTQLLSALAQTLMKK